MTGLWLLAMVVAAGPVPSPSPSADPTLKLGGEARGRFESFTNAGWANAPTDGFLLQKYLLFADWRPLPRVRLFVHMKSGLEDGRDDGPRPTDEDQLDLHEGFVEASLGADRRTTLRIGRQELAFGSQRLVSVRAGPNVRQSFDGVSVGTRLRSWRLDAFATKPVETDAGVFDDGPDHGRTFWGVYAVGPLRLFAHANIDVYVFGLDRKRARFDQGTARERRSSSGLRLWRRTAPWDYNFELVYQWGHFGPAPIRAWTVASDSGLTLSRAPWRPRFGLKANVTSGDDDPNRAELQTFNPLFPRGAYFGESALIGPANHVDIHPSIDFHPTARLTLTPSWDFFWRESTRDGLYNVAVSPMRTGAATRERYVGSQAALMVAARVDRRTTVAVGLERFFAGPFLRDSGPGRDVTFFMASLGIVF